MVHCFIAFHSTIAKRLSIHWLIMSQMAIHIIHSTATSIFQNKRGTGSSSPSISILYPWIFPHITWLWRGSALRPPHERQVRQQWLRHVATGGRRWSGEFLFRQIRRETPHPLEPLNEWQKKSGEKNILSYGGWCQTIATWFWPWWYTKTP